MTRPLRRPPRRGSRRDQPDRGFATAEEVPLVGPAVLVPAAAPAPRRRWLIVASALGLLVGAGIVGALAEIDPADQPSTVRSAPAQWPVPSSVEGSGQVLGWSSVGTPGAQPASWTSDGDQLFVLDGRSLWIEQLDGQWVERPLQERFGCAGNCLPYDTIDAHDGLVLLTAASGEAALFTVDERTGPITVSGSSPRGGIEGMEIAGQAVGPAGAIVQYTSRLDIEGLLSTVLETPRDELTYTVAGGLITVRLPESRIETLRMEDLGLTEADITGTTTQLWWAGEERAWELATTFDGDDVQVMAADSGFYAFSADRVFFSRDGRRWDRECCPRGSVDRIEPWREGVLIDDDRGLRYLTVDRDEPVPFDDLAVEAMLPHAWFELDAGAQGIVVLSSDGSEIAYSPTGIEWTLSRLGPELALDPGALLRVGPNLVLADQRSFVTWRSGEDGSIEFWRSEVGRSP